MAPMGSQVEIPSDYPPLGMEVGLVERFVRLGGKRVLEIGCGDGRLTLQYAHMAKKVVAIEAERSLVADARRFAREDGLTNVTFHAGSAERMRFGGGAFDIALFSWSL